jgi:predicted nucleic acid-binding Zn ribbon protein
MPAMSTLGHDFCVACGSSIEKPGDYCLVCRSAHADGGETTVPTTPETGERVGDDLTSVRSEE